MDVGIRVILIQNLLGLFIAIEIWLSLLSQELLMLRVYDLIYVENTFQEFSERVLHILKQAF